MQQHDENKQMFDSSSNVLSETPKVHGSQVANFSQRLKEQNFNSLSLIQNALSDRPARVKPKERTRIKSEVWSHSEVKKIFRLYSEYGSQWKIIESQFADRPANSIKNRFYTVVRTMLKLLFKWHPLLTCKLPHEIPSKAILKFYEGREEFSKFKGFGKKVLKMVDYDLDSRDIRAIAKKNESELLELYQVLFDKKSLKVLDGRPITKKPNENATELSYQAEEQKAFLGQESVDQDSKDKIKVQTCPSLPQQCEGVIFLVPMMNPFSQGFVQFFPLL